MEDSTLQTKSLTQSDKEAIIREFVIGEPSNKNLKKDLANKYNISPSALTHIISSSPRTNARIEKQMLEIPLARENARIQKLKDLIYDVTEDLLLTLKDKEADDKIPASFLLDTLGNINNLRDSLDKSQRLNANMSTENIQSSTAHTQIDVAEILKTLDTPEKKKAYLLEGKLPSPIPTPQQTSTPPQPKPKKIIVETITTSQPDAPKDK